MPKYVNVFKTELIYPKLTIINFFYNQLFSVISLFDLLSDNILSIVEKPIVKMFYLLIVNQGSLKQQK